MNRLISLDGSHGLKRATTPASSASTAAWKAANELYDEIGNRNERFKRIWESYRKYRDEEFLWFRVAEYSYANFAFTAAQTVK